MKKQISIRSDFFLSVVFVALFFIFNQNALAETVTKCSSPGNCVTTTTTNVGQGAKDDSFWDAPTGTKATPAPTPAPAPTATQSAPKTYVPMESTSGGSNYDSSGITSNGGARIPGESMNSNTSDYVPGPGTSSGGYYGSDDSSDYVPASETSSSGYYGSDDASDYVPGVDTNNATSGGQVSSSSGSGFWSSVGEGASNFFGAIGSALLGSGDSGSGGYASGRGGGWSISNISGLGLPSGTLMSIVYGILGWLLAIIGLVGIIGFIISGAMYILSSGDEKMAGQAKTAMTNSIIGIIVALSGYVIIQAIDAVLMGWSNF